MLRRDPLPVLASFLVLRCCAPFQRPANNRRFCQYLCSLLRDIKIIARLIIGNRWFPRWSHGTAITWRPATIFVPATSTIPYPRKLFLTVLFSTIESKRWGLSSRRFESQIKRGKMSLWKRRLKFLYFRIVIRTIVIERFTRITKVKCTESD